MPSRRLATPCRGGSLNLPLQVTSLPSPSLSSLPSYHAMPCLLEPVFPLQCCTSMLQSSYNIHVPASLYNVLSFQFPVACLPASLPFPYLPARRAVRAFPRLPYYSSTVQFSGVPCQCSLPACLPVSLSHTCLRAEQSCRATSSTQPTRILTYPALPCLDHPISNYCTLPCSASPT